MTIDMIEGVSTDSDVIGDDSALLSESILKAQLEADRAADEAERVNNDNDENAPLVAPKLLELQKQDILDKTNVWKQKNSQLDILLLKAESYSHFILENQKRANLSDYGGAADSEKKRRANDHASPSRSPKKGRDD